MDQILNAVWQMRSTSVDKRWMGSMASEAIKAEGTAAFPIVFRLDKTSTVSGSAIILIAMLLLS